MDKGNFYATVLIAKLHPSVLTHAVEFLWKAAYKSKAWNKFPIRNVYNLGLEITGCT